MGEVARSGVGAAVLCSGMRLFTWFSRNQSEPYCCPGLRYRIEDAGRGGLAFLVLDDGRELRMVMQSRGIPYAEEYRIADEPDPRDRIWHVSMSTGLRFCPFCGRAVHRTLRAARAHFTALAAVHAAYADDYPDRPVIRGRKVM